MPVVTSWREDLASASNSLTLINYRLTDAVHSSVLLLISFVKVHDESCEAP